MCGHRSNLSGCAPEADCCIAVLMSLVVLLLLLSQLCGTQQEKLGWFETGRGTTSHNGRIGAIGGQAETAADLDRLPSSDVLTVLRDSGAATFVSAQHTALPFDLAAKLVDGLLITEGGDRALALWSLLLDHGYALSPMAVGDGRLYVHCPDGPCVAEAVRQHRTIVSTGPILTAVQSGKQIEVNVWPRPGRPEPRDCHPRDHRPRALHRHS